MAYYDVALFLHITGIAMLMGNITVTAIWKFFADREDKPDILRFAQKLITYTDWSMTAWGAGLIMASGYFMAIYARIPLMEGWLLWGQVFFVVSGLIWLCLIVPIQIRQSRIAQAFEGDDVGDEYRALSARWIMWGLISTVPLVAATWLMVAKPG